MANFSYFSKQELILLYRLLLFLSFFMCNVLNRNSHLLKELESALSPSQAAIFLVYQVSRSKLGLWLNEKVLKTVCMLQGAFLALSPQICAEGDAAFQTNSKPKPCNFRRVLTPSVKLQHCPQLILILQAKVPRFHWILYSGCSLTPYGVQLSDVTVLKYCKKK